MFYKSQRAELTKDRDPDKQGNAESLRTGRSSGEGLGGSSPPRDRGTRGGWVLTGLDPHAQLVQRVVLARDVHVLPQQCPPGGGFQAGVGGPCGQKRGWHPTRASPRTAGREAVDSRPLGLSPAHGPSGRGLLCSMMVSVERESDHPPKRNLPI